MSLITSELYAGEDFLLELDETVKERETIEIELERLEMMFQPMFKKLSISQELSCK